MKEHTHIPVKAKIVDNWNGKNETSKEEVVCFFCGKTMDAKTEGGPGK